MLYVIKYTLIENLRNKIYLSSIVLLLVISLLSWIGASINFNFSEYYISTLAFGMSLTDLLAIVIALFLPVNNMSLEFERGTAWVIWSKLRGKGQYYLGKYFAYLILITILVTISSIFIVIISLFMGANLNHMLLLKNFILFETLEVSCILALVFLLYSFFRSSILASLFSLLIIYFSVFLETAKEIASSSNSLVTKLWYNIIYYMMPNLSYFNVENHIIYNQPLSYQYIWLSALYAIIFTGILMSISIIIMEKREL